MRKLFDFKLIFIAIFLLLAIAIENSENFQLRDSNDGVSAVESGRGVSKKTTTKVRFPFKKLEKVDLSAEVDDDDDDDDDDGDNDDENDSEEEDTKDFKFAKVRKPNFEVKKRTNLRFSKLAQFREPDEDDENDGKVSFLSKIWNFFKRKPKETAEENDSKENTADDDSTEEVEAVKENDEDDDEEKKKPFLSEIFEKFKDFLEARDKQQKVTKETESGEDDDDSNSSGEGSGSDNDDDEAAKEPSSEKISKPAENKPASSVKETLTAIFNRKPFNLIFDFDDSDDEKQTFEDSEEDEINYQRLLKEERDHAREHTEQLINHTSEEEPLAKPEQAASEQAAEKKVTSTPKREKKTKEEAHLARKEFEKLLLSLPSFVPDYSKVRNPECQKQGEVFQRQLRGQRIWALEMMDANAKIPSGLMRGNTNQLGDFDLCTKISQKIKISETNNMKMKGKYCLANIDVVAAADQLKLPVHLIQGRNFIRSKINDVSFVF